MAILDVVEWPAKVLETKAEPVTKFDEELKTFVANMKETMISANGIGLAANQVGDLRRVIVIQIPYVAPEEGENAEEKRPWHDQEFVLINPEIVAKKGKIKYMEGCLSFPEMFDFVDRAAELTLKYFDENGNEKMVEADGLFSVCIQHEIDHIDGIVFIKRMSRLKSGRIKKKMMERASARAIAE